MPLIEIKDFNLLINNKPFFDQPVKKKTRSIRKTCQNVMKLYHQKHYEPLHSITKLFISGKQQKAILNFSIDSLIVTEQYN